MECGCFSGCTPKFQTDFFGVMNKITAYSKKSVHIFWSAGVFYSTLHTARTKSMECARISARTPYCGIRGRFRFLKNVETNRPKFRTEHKKTEQISALFLWCGIVDLNHHELLHTALNRTRLPIPPIPHVHWTLVYISTSSAQCKYQISNFLKFFSYPRHSVLR